MPKEIIENHISFQIVHGQEWISFVFEEKEYQNLKTKSKNLDLKVALLHDFLLDEFIRTKKYRKLDRGWSVMSTDFMRIQQDFFEAVGLPINRLEGDISLRVKGINAYDKHFSISVNFSLPNQSDSRPYYTAGYILKTGNRMYHLDTNQENAFRTYRSYFENSNKTAQDHYHLVSVFKKIGSQKVKVDTNRFDRLEISDVEKVGVRVTKLDSGNIELSPNLIGSVSNDEARINRELKHIKPNSDSTTLHVGNELIQIKGKQLKAVKKLQKKRLIPREESTTFIENPGSYLDPELFDLSHFSIRVEGIQKFMRIPLVDFDEIKNDWFLTNKAPIEYPMQLISKKLIKNEEDIEEFEKLAIQAYDSKNDKILYKRKEVSLPERKQLDEWIEELKTIIRKLEKEKLEKNQKENDDSDVIKPEESKIHYAIKFFPKNKALRNLYTENNALPKDIYSTLNLNFKPLEHQKEAVKWIYNLYQSSLKSKGRIRGGILADDMGLGKTLTCLLGMKSIVDYHSEVNKKNDKSFMVVAPVTLLKNWKEEYEKFFNIGFFTDIIILNTQADLDKFKLTKYEDEIKQEHTPGEPQLKEMERRLKIKKDGFGETALDLPGRLILTNYETMARYQFSMGLIDFHCVIFDEGQRIKNPNTIATITAKALKSDLNIISTGTPVENRLQEFWCLMDTCNPELLGTSEEFVNAYVRPLNKNRDESFKLKLGKDLYYASLPFLIRRTKEELKDKLGNKLPQKKLFKGLKSDNAEYDSALDKMMPSSQLINLNEIRKLKLIEHKRSSTLVHLNRIRACMLHPRLTFTNNSSIINNITKEEFWFESARLEALYAIITKVKNLDEKLIIFVISRSIQYVLKNWIYRGFNVSPDIISGITKTESDNLDETRIGLINKFSKQNGFNIIILSPRAAGVGLNITAANHIFHLERDWNPAKESQANDRAYRIGQDKNVNIYYPISKHPTEESFDIVLDHLLSRKTFLKDTLMTYPKSIESQLGSEIFN